MHEEEESNEALLIAIELLGHQVDADTIDYLGVHIDSATNIYLQEFQQYNDRLKIPSNHEFNRTVTTNIRTNFPDLHHIPHITPDTISSLFNVLKQNPINVRFINPEIPLTNNTIF
jgi:hypothetical protein